MFSEFVWRFRNLEKHGNFKASFEELEKILKLKFYKDPEKLLQVYQLQLLNI